MHIEEDWRRNLSGLLGALVLLQRVPMQLAVTHQAMAMLIVGLWVCALHYVQRLDPH